MYVFGERKGCQGGRMAVHEINDKRNISSYGVTIMCISRKIISADYNVRLLCNSN